MLLMYTSSLPLSLSLSLCLSLPLSLSLSLSTRTYTGQLRIHPGFYSEYFQPEGKLESVLARCTRLRCFIFCAAYDNEKCPAPAQAFIVSGFMSQGHQGGRLFTMI